MFEVKMIGLLNWSVTTIGEFVKSSSAGRVSVIVTLWVILAVRNCKLLDKNLSMSTLH